MENISLYGNTFFININCAKMGFTEPDIANPATDGQIEDQRDYR
jgi:hypothetical protein